MTREWIVSPAVAVWLLCAPAQAQQAPTPPPVPASDMADAQPLDEKALQDLNAREGVHVVVASDQLLKAVNSGNAVNADTVVSGDIRIGANAFSGFDGIGNFVMNTGHNNNLQGAITVNIATGGVTP